MNYINKDSIPLLADDGSNYEIWADRMEFFMKSTLLHHERNKYIWNVFYRCHPDDDSFESNKVTALLQLAISDKLLGIIGSKKKGIEIWFLLIHLFSDKELWMKHDGTRHAPGYFSIYKGDEILTVLKLPDNYLKDLISSLPESAYQLKSKDDETSSMKKLSTRSNATITQKDEPDKVEDKHPKISVSVYFSNST